MKCTGRMLSLKSNFKISFKGNVLCPRCEKETDNEEHLYGKRELLGDFYVKYDITNDIIYVQYDKK